MKMLIELTPMELKRIEFTISQLMPEYNKGQKGKLMAIKAVIKDAQLIHYKENLKLINYANEYSNLPLENEI